MSPFLLLQQEPWTPITVAIIGGGGMIAVAVISAGGTWLAMKRKNKGDFLKSLIESLDILTRRVNSNTREMDVAQGTISRLEGEKKKESHIAELSENEIEKQRKTIDAFIEDAKTIHEHIVGMSFVTTGTPTEEDERVIWRLKMMKQAAARMIELAAEP